LTFILYYIRIRYVTHSRQHYIAVTIIEKCIIFIMEEISRLGLVDAIQKYHNKPLEREAKSIVAGPSFLQFLNKLFQIQLSTGDIIQFESGSNNKYYMLSVTGTWDEIIKLQ
jgi:hypothetical protein